MRNFAIMPAALAFIPAAALLCANPAVGQIGNPAGVMPGSEQAAPGVPAPHETNVQDRLFTRLAAAGGKAEVEIGQLAQQKALRQGVKDFARMMIEDHTKANEKLANLAQGAGIPLPAGLDPDHLAMRAKLEKLSGADFEVNYMLAQIEDHQKTAQLLKWEIGSGQNALLQQFAAEVLPTVLGHLRRAQMLAAELTGQTPPEIASR